MADNKDRPGLPQDDKRHGTNAGHVAGCREDCCNLAKLRYDKTRKRERDVTGHGRRVPATGFRRRAQALNAIGWPIRLLADELGVSLGTFSARIYKSEMVYYRTHTQMVELYDRLSMTPYEGPLSDRTRRQAKASGYVPPLMWDDIDNDPTPSDPGLQEDAAAVVDEVKVDRVLAGWIEDCNPAERLAVIDRWTGSTAELERITGWHVWRTISQRKKAA